MAPDPAPEKSTRPVRSGETGGAPREGDGSERILSEICDAWRSVLVLPLHAPGCGCCGARPGALDSSAMEQDILHYLRNKYRDQGKQQLAALVDTRAEDQRVGFLAWLRGLMGRSDTENTEKFLKDILKVMNNISEGRKK